MSNVRRILCHAEFTCERCGKPYTCMGLAEWEDGRGIVGDARRTGHEICNDCERADRVAEEKERHRSQEQRAWARKHRKPAHL
jgi:hypothetical protein